MKALSNKIFILGISVFLLNLSTAASAEVSVVLDPPKNGMERRIHKRLDTSSALNTAVNFLNDTFTTPRDITIQFGDYSHIWYENDTIEIPYVFIQRIREGYNNVSIPHRFAHVDEFTGNTLFHVIFHEMAHAFIEQYDLPVIGKEEDAADGLADVLLIHFFDHGDDMVVGAADLFYINHRYNRRFRQQDYWAEHSLHIQRYYARICHAYGSNPSKHISLKRRVEFSDNHAERCIIQYRELERSWLRLLEPAFKTKPL